MPSPSEKKVADSYSRREYDKRALLQNSNQ
jgi:hypothetical protein